MDYKRIYNNIIERRKNNSYTGYTEKHHILPKSLGGKDTIDNLVDLSAKEHFICHLLLTKMYPKDSIEYYKMSSAFLMMLVKSNQQNRYITSNKYAELKLARSNFMKTLVGEKNSQHATIWICNKKENINRKIKISDPIPDGWEKGRILKNNRKCNQCGKLVFKTATTKRNSRSYCSEECKIQYRKENYHKIENTILYGRDDEFIELYNIHKSINKSLKLMGFVGAGGYYVWAKEILAKRALIV